ncbi:MAG: hypothetical protein JF597_23790 [Streptomyces sp.]|jgi:hypothetical protein|uniref:hypothetical protein n=1 Tax=Streptomyces sp. TaxID=1931 RepID=UPI0025E45B42|nr:hypothetical protein [Streptomyces sp.]MBW8796506.1 hypothetical protein [Streptomyces sp.]
MVTLTLPRTAGSRAGATVVLTALAAAGASWVAAPNAAAQGENGDIRLHRVGVPFGVSKDDPLVCKFYLDAVNFDILTSIGYTITPQPPLPTAATVAGSIQLAGGAGHTDPLGLADGQYRLTWIVDGARKEKVFRVNCHDGRQDGPQGQNGPNDQNGPNGGPNGGPNDQNGQNGPNGPNGQIEDNQRGDTSWGQGGDHNGPQGGVHAGGGGIADATAAFSPVAAATAVTLVAASGVVYVRLIRRRPNGAA